MGALLEIAIGQTLCFSFAIGFDEANLRSELVESIFQRGTDRLILREIEHYRRDWMWEARGRESLTPSASWSGGSLPRGVFWPLRRSRALRPSRPSVL